jgi:hypothetical protein
LPEPQLGRVEEHLFWCHGCHDGAKGVQRFIDAVRL